MPEAAHVGIGRDEMKHDHTKSVARSAVVGGLALLAGLLATNPAAAETVEEFYTGKTLTIVLGHPPGGSYDFYARLAAQHLKTHLPGHPNIVVTYRPGGGGVAAAAFFYAQSPRDGTTLSLFSETIAHTQVLEPSIGRW